MHIDITPENLLIQLGYTPTPTLMKQMEDIINNTNGFDKFSKHLLNLSDEVQPFGGYMAMSNSFSHLKVKTDKSRADDTAPFVEILEKWSEKYKVLLKRVEGKNTFYIIGQE